MSLLRPRAAEVGSKAYPVRIMTRKEPMPPNPIANEDSIKEITPTYNARSALSRQKIAELIKNPPPNTSRYEFRAINSKSYIDNIDQDINEEWAKEFALFLQGKSKYNAPAYSNFKAGSNFLTIPDVAAYLDEPIQAKWDYQAAIAKLCLGNLKNVADVYLYFKYIASQRKNIDGTITLDVDAFLEDYNNFASNSIKGTPVFGKDQPDLDGALNAGDFPLGPDNPPQPSAALKQQQADMEVDMVEAGNTLADKAKLDKAMQTADEATITVYKQQREMERQKREKEALEKQLREEQAKAQQLVMEAEKRHKEKMEAYGKEREDIGKQLGAGAMKEDAQKMFAQRLTELGKLEAAEKQKAAAEREQMMQAGRELESKVGKQEAEIEAQRVALAKGEELLGQTRQAALKEITSLSEQVEKGKREAENMQEQMRQAAAAFKESERLRLQAEQTRQQQEEARKTEALQKAESVKDDAIQAYQEMKDVAARVAAYEALNIDIRKKAFDIANMPAPNIQLDEAAILRATNEFMKKTLEMKGIEGDIKAHQVGKRTEESLVGALGATEDARIAAEKKVIELTEKAERVEKQTEALYETINKMNDENKLQLQDARAQVKAFQETAEEAYGQIAGFLSRENAPDWMQKSGVDLYNQFQALKNKYPEGVDAMVDQGRMRDYVEDLNEVTAVAHQVLQTVNLFDALSMQRQRQQQDDSIASMLGQGVTYNMLKDDQQARERAIVLSDAVSPVYREKQIALRKAHQRELSQLKHYAPLPGPQLEHIANQIVAYNNDEHAITNLVKQQQQQLVEAKQDATGQKKAIMSMDIAAAMIMAQELRRRSRASPALMGHAAPMITA